MEGLTGLVILLAIFLFCREIVCWYWKMNEVVVLLNKQINYLKIISGEEKLPEKIINEPTVNKVMEKQTKKDIENTLKEVDRLKSKSY